MRRKLLLTILAVALTFVLRGQVTFEVEGPKVVTVGEVFRVEFVVNDTDVKQLTPPTLEGFDVLAGPSVSTAYSRTVDNGKVVKTATVSYTYVLQCSSEGDFTISPAEVTVKGKTYRTKPLTIKAVTEMNSGESDAGQQARSSQQRNNGSNNQKEPTTISANDIFVRAVVDKINVYKGQPVKVALKLYTRFNSLNVENFKFPAFNGFWSQPLNGEYQWEREYYNNRIYNTHIIREYLLYPQQAGTLTIEQFELSALIIIAKQQAPQSIFDDFFGGIPDTQEYRKVLQSQPVRITVKELPAGAPSSFTGAVGEFEMSSQTPSTDMKVNSASTYTIKISGNGNLPLIQAPQLTLPTSFEQYNVKASESLQSSSSGISGYRQFEYPMIARAEGDFTIPAVEFSYFNPRTMNYVTVSSNELNVTVAPDSTQTQGSSRGLVSGLSKEDLKFLGQDIRFIKLGQSGLKTKDKLFMWSGSYYLILIVIAALAVFAFFWLRKWLKEQRNIALLKGKRANKVALQRFRAAEKDMNDDNQRGFYEEMLKALWGYMGDKLNIPVANLTKESVREELIKRGVQTEQAERYIAIISECEYAQYSPDSIGKMHEQYVDGVEIVSKFESIINK